MSDTQPEPHARCYCGHFHREHEGTVAGLRTSRCLGAYATLKAAPDDLEDSVEVPCDCPGFRLSRRTFPVLLNAR